MRTKLCLLALCFWLPAGLMAMSDEEIKSMIVRSTMYIDNGRGAARSFNSALQRCDNDTNRFVRLLMELSQTNNVRIAESMFMDLGNFCDCGQLPLLYDNVTNAEYGTTAMESILRIEGLTTNSLAAAARYFAADHVYGQYRSNVCGEIFRMAQKPSVAPDIKALAVSNCIDYAMYAVHIYSADTQMAAADLGYKYSKRRLAVLRAKDPQVVTSFQANYITNAINELVAYPESELPE